MLGLLGSKRDDLAPIEGDIVSIEADIVLIFALLFDIDVAITNIEAALVILEAHAHSYERWMQPTKQADGEVHVASRIGVGLGDFQIDAGSNDWGAWLQVLGSADTPVQPGFDQYCLHRLTFTSTERDEPYFVQVAMGTSGAAALTAGTFTELVYTPASNKISSCPVDVCNALHAAGTKAWVRCMCPGQDTAQMDFFIGLHELEVEE